MGLAPFTQAVDKGWSTTVGDFPWVKRSQDHRLGSQTQSTSARISQPHSIWWWEVVGFCLLATKPLFFPMAPKSRFCFRSHSPWAPAKEGQHRLESSEESLEWETLGKRWGGMVMMISVLGYAWSCSSHLAYPILWNLTYPILHLLLFLLFCFGFFAFLFHFFHPIS